MVTGGAGFIGSHVAGIFKANGHEVLALDDLSRGKRENLDPAIPLETVDLTDRDELERAFSEFQPQAVNHHAAQVSVRESVADPVHDARINVIGSLNLLELCVKHQTRRVLFSSTGGAIYGEQEKFPAPENHPERPLSPYAVAKLAVEKYLYFYEQTYGLAWCALRYANVYGPRQDPFGEAGVVAIFAERMLAGQNPLINGDGDQTRDFVFVEDVARANLDALEKKIAGPINIGSGIETTVNEIFRTLKEITGARIQELHGPEKSGEQRRSVLDPARAEKIMGWRPQTTLKQGLEKTVEFFRKAQKR